jgi:hypothetical protein
MLADSQPIAHPPKNTVKVCHVVSPARSHRVVRMTAQTIAQAML